MNSNCRLHDLLLIRGPLFPSNGIQTSKPYLSPNQMLTTTAPKRRYSCPKCPYSTDRRDLYTRHENIHRDEKPFRCYVCEKMFNRADHVKKHFLRIHKGLEYDVKLTKRVKGRDYDVVKELNNNAVQQQSTCFATNPLLSELLQYRRAFIESKHKPSKEDQNPVAMVTVPVTQNQSQEEDFQCEYCGCAFIDYSSLHTHRYLLHRYLLETSNYFPYRCVICGVRKTTQRSMMAHMSNHRLNDKIDKKETKSGANRRKQLQPRKIVKFLNNGFLDVSQALDNCSHKEFLH